MQVIMRRKLIFSGECILSLGLLEVMKVYWNITVIFFGGGGALISLARKLLGFTWLLLDITGFLNAL